MFAKPAIWNKKVYNKFHWFEANNKWLHYYFNAASTLMRQQSKAVKNECSLKRARESESERKKSRRAIKWKIDRSNEKFNVKFRWNERAKVSLCIFVLCAKCKYILWLGVRVHVHISVYIWPIAIPSLVLSSGLIYYTISTAEIHWWIVYVQIFIHF